MVLPKSVEELRSLLSWANQDRHTVLVCGNGSKLTWGNPIPPTDVIISLTHLNQIIDHAVGESTITVQAGLSFQALQAHLKPTGQMLPVDPYAPEQASIGGILATRDAGSLRHRYGGVRDTCLGLSFVRSDGELAKGGGRVVKNVAGYDLMKLFTGSFGTLGIISEVTLRLYPIQESSHTVILSGPPGAIATVTAKVLDSTLTPVAIDLLSQTKLEAIDLPGELGLAVRFQSLEESVSAQVARLKDLGESLQMQDYVGSRDEQIWQTLQQIQWQGGDHTLIAKVGLLPTEIPNLLPQIQGWCDQQLSLIHISEPTRPY